MNNQNNKQFSKKTNMDNFEGGRHQEGTHSREGGLFDSYSGCAHFGRNWLPSQQCLTCSRDACRHKLGGFAVVTTCCLVPVCGKAGYEWEFVWLHVSNSFLS